MEVYKLGRGDSSHSENKAIKTIIWADLIVWELYGLIKNHGNTNLLRILG